MAGPTDQPVAQEPAPDAQDVYTLVVHIEDKDTHNILREGKYKLRVGNLPDSADGDEYVYRDNPPIIHTNEPTGTCVHSSLIRTYDVYSWQ